MLWRGGGAALARGPASPLLKATGCGGCGRAAGGSSFTRLNGKAEREVCQSGLFELALIWSWDGFIPVSLASLGPEATASRTHGPPVPRWPHWWPPNLMLSSCPPASAAQSKTPQTS